MDSGYMRYELWEILPYRIVRLHEVGKKLEGVTCNYTNRYDTSSYGPGGKKRKVKTRVT